VILGGAYFIPAPVDHQRGIVLPRIFRLSFLLILLVLSGSPARAAAPALRFVVDGPAARTAAETCAAIWRDEGAALTAALLPAGTAVDTVTCVVLGTEEFRNRFAGALPDWGVGVALRGGRVVALDYLRIPAVGRGLREVFLHEMVHALLYQAAPDAWLPTWFHEGSAMLWSGEWRFADTVSLALAGRVPDLDRLQGRFPTAAATADRAYRTSLLAVTWLEERHGPDAVPAILAATRDQGDFTTGFAAATGEELDAFVAAFAGRMRLRFGWLVLLTRWPTLFVLLALVLVLGAARKVIVGRRRLAAMADEEALPPA
jgi:hypothetical protein